MKSCHLLQYECTLRILFGMKQARQRQILYYFSKKRNKQKKTKLIDTKNRMMVAGGRGVKGGGNDEGQ